MSERPAELADIRQSFIEFKVPVLLDAAEAAIPLDLTEQQVRNRFDNYVMVGERYLVRTVEIRLALLAMKPKSVAPRTERVCRSCRAPLPAGKSRFCSPRCSRMTPTARAALLANL